MLLSQMVMESMKESNNFELNFMGYGVLGRDEAQEAEGIYCIYREASNVQDMKLLYIGQSKNISERLKQHETNKDWEHERKGRRLLFSYALFDGTDEERKRIEAALIFRHKPKCNTQGTDSFSYDTARIKITGKTEGLCTDFTVFSTERSR